MNDKPKLGDFPIGSLESRAAARVRLEQKRSIADDPYSADFEFVSTGVGQFNFGRAPIVNPPDSIAYYEAPDGSVVRIIRRQYEADRFTAYIYQAWQNGAVYHGTYRVGSLADLKRLARPAASGMELTR